MYCLYDDSGSRPEKSIRSFLINNDVPNINIKILLRKEMSDSKVVCPEVTRVCASLPLVEIS